MVGWVIPEVGTPESINSRPGFGLQAVLQHAASPHKSSLDHGGLFFEHRGHAVGSKSTHNLLSVLFRPRLEGS